MTNTQIIPLIQAYLCADLECKTISNDFRRCPVCHSTVQSLAAVLGRKEEHKGILAFRQNTGAMRAEYKGKTRFMRFGVPGMADILAFRSRGVDPNGAWCSYIEPIWIECKAPKGVQSDLQKSFQKQVESHGHRYIVARSLEDVLEIL
jgi:hypothetical protein